MSAEQLAILNNESGITPPATPSVMVPSSPTPAELLRIALSQNADIDKLKQLMDLQERWEKNEARKAFVQAMNQFKEHPPQLEKVKKVDFSSKGGNRVHYNYAPLDHIAKILGEALSRQGLSFRWDVEQSDNRTKVTCILQHSGGHSQSVSLVAGLHDDERMNAIQRLGSTITYLERYTLLAATGMATEEQDTDANEALTMGDLAERVEYILNGKDREETRKLWEVHFKAAKDVKDTNAMAALTQAKNKRFQELGK